MSTIAGAKAEPLWFLDNLAVIHARAEDTNGGYGIVEMLGARGDMPPLHVHPHDDEGFYVIDGRLRLYFPGGDTREIGAGEFALAPRGVPHVYEVISDGPTRWLALSNGGFEAFVAEVSEPADEAVLPASYHGPAPEELPAIAARHGIEVLGPPGTLP